jgi:acyl carrier protein
VAADALIIDTFLLSCRALGRGVEHRMIAALGAIARDRGIPVVEARYTRTPRNRPALLFLESAGLQFQAVRSDHLAFRFPAGFAAQLRFEPSGASPAPAPALEPSEPVRRPAIPYARIAAELRDPEKILARVRTVAAPLIPGDRIAEPPRSALEAQLCHLWSEMLGVRPVGIHDNFFDLGGHSLLAVQLLSRIQEKMGVELSLDVVYSADFTIAELAKAIELREIELAGADDYSRLLAEVEAMTDDEVRALLAQEGEAS